VSKKRVEGVDLETQGNVGVEGTVVGERRSMENGLRKLSWHSSVQREGKKKKVSGFQEEIPASPHIQYTGRKKIDESVCAPRESRDLPRDKVSGLVKKEGRGRGGEEKGPKKSARPSL